MTKSLPRPVWLADTKNIIQRRGWWCLRPYTGTDSQGRPKYGPEKRIIKAGCTAAEFFKAHAAVAEQPTERTLRWLLDQYHKSPKFKSTSKSYQRDALNYYYNALCGRKFKSGNYFGDMPLKAITKPKIQKFIDTGNKTPSGTNHQIQYLRAAWYWAERRFEDIPPNPCSKVELHKTTSPARYIPEWEYAVAFACALSRRNPMFAAAMELSYLCRARRIEVFNLQTKDVDKTVGIYLERTKGSNPEVTLLSPRLRDALDLCSEVYPRAPTPIKGRHLLHDRHGLPWTKKALDTAWKRVMTQAIDLGAEIGQELAAEAQKAGARVEGARVWLDKKFRFHDIKHTGITDHESDNAGLHKSERMQKLYDHKIKRMPATR